MEEHFFIFICKKQYNSAFGQIVDHVMEKGSCQDLTEVPESIRKVFVVSQDITAEEHVRMQAAMQAFVDNSLSKTINFPEDATEEDVATSYQLAWKLGCKGITVYITGSRQKVVLETKAVAKQKQPILPIETGITTKAEQLRMWQETKKPRPRRLPGYTYNIGTPVGKAFVTINENGDKQPFEVFISTAKAGSEIAAISEAIGRLISYILRLASTGLRRAQETPLTPMIRREPFRQTLVGSYLLEAATGAGLPATLELRGNRPLLVPGLGRSISVEGELSARGLCERCPVRGRVTFDRWTPLAVHYDLELSLADGTACRLHGSPSAGLRGFLSAASSIHADLVGPGGRRLAQFQLRFDYRRDLLRYLT